MEQKANKLQIYLDEKTGQKIKDLAKNNTMSVSKYAARVLENHATSGLDTALFQIKIQAMLSQILGSVYDYEVVKSNTDEIKKLLQKIEDKAKEKLTEQTS